MKRVQKWLVLQAQAPSCHLLAAFKRQTAEAAGHLLVQPRKQRFYPALEQAAVLEVRQTGPQGLGSPLG